MANPKIPPDIAKRIAAMKPAAPAAAPRAPAPAGAVPRPASAGGVMGKVAAVGWVLALLAGGAAFFEYRTADQQKTDALAAQADDYKAKMDKVQADAAAQVKLAQDTAAAQVKLAQDTAAGQLTSLQTDLDFQKMPEIPLETAPRANQVLYVNNTSGEAFSCKVRLFRPVGAVTKEVDFSIKGNTYQDMGAIGDWVFQKGDKLDFLKPGFKPRTIQIP